MSSVTQHGKLVIAGISGQTSFVAKTELEFLENIHVAWIWFQNPEMRNQVIAAVHGSMEDLPLGHSAMGASNHRAYGSEVSTETNRFEEFPSICTRIHALILLARHHYYRTLMDTAKLAREQNPAVAESE